MPWIYKTVNAWKCFIICLPHQCLQGYLPPKLKFDLYVISISCIIRTTYYISILILIYINFPEYRKIFSQIRHWYDSRRLNLFRVYHNLKRFLLTCLVTNLNYHSKKQHPKSLYINTAITIGKILWRCR